MYCDHSASENVTSIDERNSDGKAIVMKIRVWASGGGLSCRRRSDQSSSICTHLRRVPCLAFGPSKIRCATGMLTYQEDLAGNGSGNPSGNRAVSRQRERQLRQAGAGIAVSRQFVHDDLAARYIPREPHWLFVIGYWLLHWVNESFVIGLAL
jgi:hypothetical protein